MEISGHIHDRAASNPGTFPQELIKQETSSVADPTWTM